MKILAIYGSPHRGNCYHVLNSIQENFPDIDSRIIMPNELNLEQCKGCYLRIAGREIAKIEKSKN